VSHQHTAAMGWRDRDALQVPSRPDQQQHHEYHLHQHCSLAVGRLGGPSGVMLSWHAHGDLHICTLDAYMRLNE
jgi:hypothetical protein